MRLPLLIISIFAFACTQSTITRMDSSKIVDLSGEWNSADSQIVSKAIVNKALMANWRDDFVEINGRKPYVIVGRFINKSHEHINTETVVKDIETELINSGKIRFVASSSERLELRKEKEDQAMFSSANTRKKSFEETGADFLLRGQINTIVDEMDKKSLKFYQVEAELINIQTNEKVWIGQKKIQKLVQRKKFKL